MKNKFKVLSLLCVINVLNAADAGEAVKPSKELAEEEINRQLVLICQKMKTHSEKGGKEKYESLQADGISAPDALTTLCYHCSRIDFETAVRTCKWNLIRALSQAGTDATVGILDRFKLEAELDKLLPTNS